MEYRFDAHDPPRIYGPGVTFEARFTETGVIYFFPCGCIKAQEANAKP